MRGIYKAFLFLLIFQMSAMMIAVMHIFPVGMYSDINFNDLDENSNWFDYVKYFFGASYGEFWGDSGALAILGISGLIFGVGAFMSVYNGNITPIMTSIFAVMALHMISTSKEFFSTMFQKGGIGVVYLGICIFVALGAMILFTIIEMPSGGDSG